MKQRTPAETAREALEDLLKQHEKNDAALADLNAITTASRRTIFQTVKAAALMKAIIPGGFRKELRLLAPIDAALAAMVETDPIPAELIRLRYVEGLTWTEAEEILQIWPEERDLLEEQGLERIGRFLSVKK